MTEPCKYLTLGDRVRITRDITEYREQFNFKAGMLGTIVGILAQNPGTKEDAFDVHPDSYPKGWEIPLDTSVLEREGAASQSGTAPMTQTEGDPWPKLCPCCGATEKQERSLVYKGWGDPTYMRNYYVCYHPWHFDKWQSGRIALMEKETQSWTAQRIADHNATYDELREEIERLRKELARFVALETHLPPLFAIGDDATAELAIQLSESQRELADLRAQLAGKG